MVACCGGKGKSGGDEIPCAMKDTKVAKFDELFKEGSEALKLAEDFRAGLKDSKATCMALSGAYSLKTGGMGDAFQCWLWSVGAEVGADKLSAIKPKLDAVKGSFDIDIDVAGLSEENKEFLEAFKCWCGAVAGAPASVMSIGEKLAGVSTKAGELAGTAKDDISGAGLGAADAMKAMAAMGSNTKTLATGTTKLTSLGAVGQEALTDMKDLAANLTSLVTEAAKNCTEGKEKGATTAKEFCEKQHSGEKLGAAEAKNDANLLCHEKRKEAGRKLPSGESAGGDDAAAGDASPDAAPEAASAPEEDEGVKTEDVKAEMNDV